MGPYILWYALLLFSYQEIYSGNSYDVLLFCCFAVICLCSKHQEESRTEWELVGFSGFTSMTVPSHLRCESRVLARCHY